LTNSTPIPPDGQPSDFVSAPTFPLSLLCGEVNVLLKADGSWEGNIAALRSALLSMKGKHDPIGGVLMWLLLRELERQPILDSRSSI
jgi:hypothetical protein